MLVWLLCALLYSLIGQAEQDGNRPPVKEVTVYEEGAKSGAWVLNVKWRDDFDENTKSEELTYDIEVFHTEHMRSVHFETIHVNSDVTTPHHWNWTSSVPLQCTSHSVRLRRHNQHHTTNWTPLYHLEGKDRNAWKTTVYPHEQFFLVGSNITFCCILKKQKVQSFISSEFKIRISNRTYITEPVHLNTPEHHNIICDDRGSTVFVGYPPDDQNLTCVTRDLTSVECQWKRGRSTHLPENKRTTYTLNGRDCKFGQCVHNDTRVTRWTLIARNPLGTKEINDSADPLHRVWLRAPINILPHAVDARNATLQWSWNVKEYASFPMTCQVILYGNYVGVIKNRTFSGNGLSSVVLADLQPDTDYTATVRCTSKEHFYKWGSWSSNTSFFTKADIPEAVDVWMQNLEQNTYVLWKPLTKQQSNGMITGYELTLRNSKSKTETNIHIEPQMQACHNLSSEDRIITVSARNSAGLSKPSTITIPSYPDKGVNYPPINSRNGDIEMFWEESSESSCGYVVDWFPTYSKKPCAVEWKKIPPGHLSTRIQSEWFDSGVRYTFSVYACTATTPQLLQRREGYAKELKPSGQVQNLKGEPKGKTAQLFWDEVPLDKQRGFIHHYKVMTFHSEDLNKPINTAFVKEPPFAKELDPGSYTFVVSALTSAGEGVNTTLEITMPKSIKQMIIASSGAALLFIIITVLCYRKRKWLKKILYPDIPAPKLSGEWKTKSPLQGTYNYQTTEKYMKCEIQGVQRSEHPEAPLQNEEGYALISSNPRMCPSNTFCLNNTEYPVAVSSIPGTSAFPMDTSPSAVCIASPCAETPCSILENLTYNMSLAETLDFFQISEQISGLTLEIQDNYLPVPSAVHTDVDAVDSMVYKPQPT